MKIHSLTGKGLTRPDIENDFKTAHPIGSMRVGASGIFLKAGLKQWFVPYSEITRCFRRVEMVQTRLCCGSGSLNFENLVICSGDKEIAVVSLPGEKAGKAALQEITEKAPHIQIGKPKDHQEQADNG